MYFTREFDNAMQDYRKEQKKKEKAQKLMALINDNVSTEGEKDSARRALKRLGY